jgi:5-methylcytosine-specific restriction endonuclease McrA
VSHLFLDRCIESDYIYVMSKRYLYSRTFTYDQCVEIWDAHQCGESIRKLAQKYSSSRNAIKTIVSRPDPRKISVDVPVCQYCGGTLSLYGKKFCSRKCMGNYFRENYSSLYRTRMKLQNPMKDSSIRDRVSKTLREGYKSGRIKKTFGRNHPRWIGNRPFCKACRDHLYEPWTKKVLERDDYTCQICGVKGYLHVHHVRPFRVILSEIISQNDICLDDIIIGSHIYDDLIQKVIDSHCLDDGITVCPSCHSNIDNYYRRE